MLYYQEYHATLPFVAGPQRRSKQGKYIYIESSTPRSQGHEAMLRVKLEGRSFCMRFWYHMFGDPGSLTVMRIVKKEKDDHIPTRKDFKKELHMEWERSVISVNKWLLAEVELAVVRSVRRGTVHWVRCLFHFGSLFILKLVLFTYFLGISTNKVVVVVVVVALWLTRIQSARCISPFQISSVIKASLYTCLAV